MTTCKALILKAFDRFGGAMSIPEVARYVTGYSENNIATRLSEIQREGKLCSRFREGKNYKEWYLPVEQKTEYKFIENQGVFA